VSQLPNLRYYTPATRLDGAPVIDVDVCIYGGSSAGVAAAVAAKRAGRSVALAAFDGHVGGLSSGGLGATDIGNKAAIGGISREFYRRLGEYYEQDEAWTFEPHVAERVFLDMLEAANVPIRYHQHLCRVHKDGTTITAIEMTDGTVYRAKAFIDATYEGDLMAMAGVSYHVGREDNSVYNETLNGVHFGHPNHNFKAWVDPHVVPGDATSGLLPLVQDASAGLQGQGDRCVQAYNFRMCLTDVAANRLPFPKPADYDPNRYELLRRYIEAGVWDLMWLTIRMPNGKTDTNNYGAIGTDHIGANFGFPDGTYAERETIFQDHVSYTAGLFFYLQSDLLVPTRIREEMSRWGLCRDEFVETGGFPHQLYIREARRMIGQHVTTEHDCRAYRKAEDSVGLAAYTMDSHNCRRIVVGGRVINEGNVEVPPEKPYSISYGSIIPKRTECTNLAVPVCLSASHIAYGSIRMEPVFMVLAESAAIAASLSIENRCDLQSVRYAELSAALVEAEQILSWPAVEKVKADRKSVLSK
jgi:hypothetical protein